MKTTTILNVTATATAIALVAFSGSICIRSHPVRAGRRGRHHRHGRVVRGREADRLRPRPSAGTTTPQGSAPHRQHRADGSQRLRANHYQQAQIAARATGHTAEATVHAEASLLERQLAQAEQGVVEARRSVLRARDDKARVRAAQAVLSASTAERDAILSKLSVANTTTAKVEGDSISASVEFAAVAFLASMFGIDQDMVAHFLIAVVAALPDILAALLIVTIGYAAPKPKAAVPSPSKRKTRRRRTRPTPALKVAHAQS